MSIDEALLVAAIDSDGISVDVAVEAGMVTD